MGNDHSPLNKSGGADDLDFGSFELDLGSFESGAAKPSAERPSRKKTAAPGPDEEDEFEKYLKRAETVAAAKKAMAAQSAPAKKQAAGSAKERAGIRPAASGSKQSRTAGAKTARKKKKRKGGFPLWPVIVLLILGALFAAYMLTKDLVSYGKNRSAYDSLRDIAVVQLTPGPRKPVQTEDGEVVEEEPVSEIPLAVDWEKLKSVNPDVVAWLYCPDTVINYPVVRTADNDQYLYTNFYGESNAGGTLFADHGSSAGFLNSHFIIYGHNMKDNSMFGTLKNYGDPKYFEEHPVFYLLTPEQAYRVELLEAATIAATLDNYPTYFNDGVTAESYVGRISRNVYWFNDKADYTQYQLLTMSTCTSSDADRLIVQGVMVPIE